MAKVDMDFPSNSNKSKETREKPKSEPIAKGRVIKRQKPASTKVKETIFGSGEQSILNYLWVDVLIPAFKNLIFDTIKDGLEMRLFGSSSGRRVTRDKDKSYTSYSSYYSKRDERPHSRDISQKARTRHDFDEIVLESRGEAEEILGHLTDLVIDFGEASVADLYDSAGLVSNFTDNKYGWTDLSSATISRVRDGYLLNLPKPKILEI